MAEELRRSVEERTDFPEITPQNPDRFFGKISVGYVKRDEWIGLRHILEEETVEVGYRLRGVRDNGHLFKVNHRDYQHVVRVYQNQDDLDSEVKGLLKITLPEDVLRVIGLRD